MSARVRVCESSATNATAHIILPNVTVFDANSYRNRENENIEKFINS